MTNRLYFSILLGTLLLLNLFPLWQAAHTGGILFYQNAFDEPGYLNFEAARAGTARMRVNQAGEWLVLLGHEAGLSGGWINFLFDMGVTFGLALLLGAIFRTAGFDSERANLSSLLLLLLPALYVNIPYIYGKFFDVYLNNGLVHWMLTPQIANWLPMMRTPEPQVSYLLLALGALISMKRKTIIPLVIALPLLYPYVSVPVFFVILACVLERKWELLRKIPLLPLLASFCATAAGMFVFYTLFSDGEVRGLMTVTRLPFFSVTGAVCLVIYTLGYRRFEERIRFPLLALSLAPFAAANQQIVSGWISQPINFESYFGVPAIALLLTLILVARPVMWGKLAIYASLAALVYLQFTPLYGDYQFTKNYLLNRNLHWKTETWQALRENAEQVAVDDLDLAAAAGLAFPKQRLTAFTYQKSSILFDEERNRGAYVCARDRVLESGISAENFQRVFSVLDAAYRSQARDFIFVHHNRTNTTAVENPVLAPPQSCNSTLLFVLTRDGQEFILP